MAGPTDDHEPEGNPLARYLRYSHVGFQFFASVAIFTVLGIWIDGWLGTGVLCTILGLALGFVGGVYSLCHELFPEKTARKTPPKEGTKPSGKGEAQGPDKTPD